MYTISRRLSIHALVLVALTSLVVAHPGDPKGRQIKPPYQGPGYRASQGGVAGVDFPSDSITMLSWITIPEFGQQWANDCWGYVSPSGREHAIIGLSSGTGFVDLTVPEDPVILAVLPGPTSV